MMEAVVLILIGMIPGASCIGALWFIDWQEKSQKIQYLQRDCDSLSNELDSIGTFDPDDVQELLEQIKARISDIEELMGTSPVAIEGSCEPAKDGE
jgi:hypothetical protein